MKEVTTNIVFVTRVKRSSPLGYLFLMSISLPPHLLHLPWSPDVKHRSTDKWVRWGNHADLLVSRRHFSHQQDYWFPLRYRSVWCSMCIRDVRKCSQKKNCCLFVLGLDAVTKPWLEQTSRDRDQISHTHTHTKHVESVWIIQSLSRPSSGKVGDTGVKHYCDRVITGANKGLTAGARVPPAG